MVHPRPIGWLKHVLPRSKQEILYTAALLYRSNIDDRSWSNQMLR